MATRIANQKTYWVVGLALALLVAGGLYWYLNRDEVGLQAVSSFDECVEAGYPITENYPAQCRTPYGQTFTQDIGNELEKVDLIRIDSPRPNQAVASPLNISGEARGYWFFEASFPVKLLDVNGNQLAIGVAQAQGEWMTEDFVPFKATLNFSAPATAKGTLVLEKDNPSGLPEHADELRVPVNFENQVVTPVTSGEEPLPGSSVHDLPVSPAVAAARVHLAGRLGVEARNILVLLAEEKKWPNSCLGLEQPGEYCLQVIISGFEIKMQAQGQIYIYRTNSNGSAIRAAN